MHAPSPLVALAIGAAFLAGGCSDTADETATRIQVVIEDGEVSPRGDRVEVKAGQPVEFEITADEPGELHVHSSPEQEVGFEAGTKTYEVTIETPGVVEVELHEPEVMIVQLEVR
jgi:plastocyanin